MIAPHTKNSNWTNWNNPRKNNKWPKIEKEKVNENDPIEYEEVIVDFYPVMGIYGWNSREIIKDQE